MKKIQKQSAIATVIYALFLVMVLFELFFAIMISRLYLVSAVPVIAASVTGFLGIYKKDSRFTIASIVFIALHALSACIGFGDILGVVFALIGHAPVLYCTIQTLSNNKKYHWLEEQDGFPNFEPQLAMYDMDKQQRAIKDPYAIKKEEIEKRNAAQQGEMEEL